MRSVVGSIASWERVASPSGADVLEMRDGIRLTAALCSRVAAMLGVPAVIIKGSSLEIQGLRLGHVSSDVDVLVDGLQPAEALIAGLGRVGFRARQVTLGDKPHDHSLHHPLACRLAE